MSEIKLQDAGESSWGNQAAQAVEKGQAPPSTGGSDFGLDLREGDLEDREFAFGDRVVIREKAHIIDEKRDMEGPLARAEGRIEAEVTGAKGTVISGSYYDEKRQDEMVPMESDRGGLVYVPAKKLERAEPPARTGRVSVAVRHTLRADEKAVLSKFNEYLAKSTAAQLDGQPFPKFSAWLEEQAAAKAAQPSSRS